MINTIQSSDYSSNKQIADGIIEGWVYWDPAHALESIRSISDPASRGQAGLTAARVLSEKDPAMAAGILKPLLEQSSQDGPIVLASIASNWLDRDPIAASQWIGGLKQGPLKDIAIQKIVENLIRKDQDYTNANAWAATISDPKQRDAVKTIIKESSDSVE